MNDRHRDLAERASRVVFGYTHPLFDDGVQEGMIALWKQEEKGEPVSEALAYTIARRRCLNLLETGHTTGHERTVVNASQVAVVSLSSFVNELGSGENASVFVDPGHSTDTDIVTDVRAALKTLPPKTREYVFHRFYMEQDQRGLSKATGYTDSGNRLLWRTKYKPQVEAALREATHVA